MNYYPFHLGDYASHTAHLEPMEDLAYRRMLDAYYLREGPLPCETSEVARLTRMRGHQDAVEAVLREFFTQSADGWHHSRCDQELASYKRMSEGGKAGAAKRWAKAGDSPPIATPSPPQVNPNSNHNQNQNQNHNQSSSLRSEEGPAPKRQPVSKVPKPVDVTEEVWQSFQTIRKTKKAAITDLAILGIRREAVKAGLTLEQAMTTCCERGWAGFKAEWVERDTPAAKGASESFYERDLRAKQERWAEMTGKPFPTDDPTVIDITPTTLEISHEPTNQSR